MMTGDLNPILTIGHSSHPKEKFLELLHHQVRTVIDVRTTPYSRFVFRFNRDNLSRTLADNGISYICAGQMLGGRPELPELYTQEGRADYGHWPEARHSGTVHQGPDAAQVADETGT